MPLLVSDSDLLDRLTIVFRGGGFDAASIADIAAATGLKKSSLYHRFPGGKQQMAAEVVSAVSTHIADTVLAPLADDGPLEDRVRSVGRAFDAFYDGGTRSCLLDVMSISDPGPDVRDALRAAADGLVAAFAAVARRSGATSAAALARAQDAVASIEGALVLARVTGDRRPFARAIARLPHQLLATTAS